MNENNFSFFSLLALHLLNRNEKIQRARSFWVLHGTLHWIPSARENSSDWKDLCYPPCGLCHSISSHSPCVHLLLTAGSSIVAHQSSLTLWSPPCWSFYLNTLPCSFHNLSSSFRSQLKYYLRKKEGSHHLILIRWVPPKESVISHPSWWPHSKQHFTNIYSILVLYKGTVEVLKI